MVALPRFSSHTHLWSVFARTHLDFDSAPIAVVEFPFPWTSARPSMIPFAVASHSDTALPQSSAAETWFGSKVKSTSVIRHGGRDSVHFFTHGGVVVAVKPFSPALSQEFSATVSEQHEFLLLSVSCSNAAEQDTYDEHSEQNFGQQTRVASVVASMRPVLHIGSLPSRKLRRSPAWATTERRATPNMRARVTVVYCPDADVD